MMTLSQIREILRHIDCSCINQKFNIIAERDKKDAVNGRLYLQCVYISPYVVTNEEKEWHGRKWYLSEHMTEAEIVKTAFAAFKATVEHEIMEGFKFDDMRVFNPHASFRSLLKANETQVYRH